MQVFWSRSDQSAESARGGAGTGGVGAAKNYDYPAEMFINAGAHYVALDFVGVIEAGGGSWRDGGTGTSSHRPGLQKRPSFGGDPERIISAGIPPVAISVALLWLAIGRRILDFPMTRKARVVYERHVRFGTGATLMASYVRELY